MRFWLIFLLVMFAGCKERIGREDQWANWDRDCVCGAHMKLTVPKSKDGYAYKCLQCGRWYAWAWTDPLKELKIGD